MSTVSLDPTLTAPGTVPLRERADPKCNFFMSLSLDSLFLCESVMHGAAFVTESHDLTQTRTDGGQKAPRTRLEVTLSVYAALGESCIVVTERSGQPSSLSA